MQWVSDVSDFGLHCWLFSMCGCQTASWLMLYTFNFQESQWSHAMASSFMAEIHLDGSCCSLHREWQQRPDCCVSSKEGLLIRNSRVEKQPNWAEGHKRNLPWKVSGHKTLSTSYLRYQKSNNWDCFHGYRTRQCTAWNHIIKNEFHMYSKELLDSYTDPLFIHQAERKLTRTEK